jgi:hypothetical protein
VYARAARADMGTLTVLSEAPCSVLDRHAHRFAAQDERTGACLDECLAGSKDDQITWNSYEIMLID